MKSQAALERRLNDFVDEEVEKAAKRILQVGMKASALGGYESSTRVQNENSALVGCFDDAVTRMAWLIFQTDGNSDSACGLLDRYSNEMKDRLIEYMAKRRKSERSYETGAQSELEKKLRVSFENICFDFKNEMAGGQALKKGENISVTNVITNSPSAVQQGGVGQLNQNVRQGIIESFNNEITELEASFEFAMLAEDKQHELRDDAATIRTEIEKETPDAVRLRRLGQRFVAKLNDFECNVAANAVGSWMMAIKLAELI